jgi:hypothetical protein
MIITPLFTCFAIIGALIYMASERRVAFLFGVFPLIIMIFMSHISSTHNDNILAVFAAFFVMVFISFSFIVEEIYRYYLSSRTLDTRNYIIFSFFIIVIEGTEKIINSMLLEDNLVSRETIFGIFSSSSLHFLNSSIFWYRKIKYPNNFAISLIICSSIHYFSNRYTADIFYFSESIFITISILMLLFAVVMFRKRLLT